MSTGVDILVGRDVNKEEVRAAIASVFNIPINNILDHNADYDVFLDAVRSGTRAQIFPLSTGDFVFKIDVDVLQELDQQAALKKLANMLDTFVAVSNENSQSPYSFILISPNGNMGDVTLREKGEAGFVLVGNEAGDSIS